VWLVGEVVAWSAAAGTGWVSTLNHEAVDDAVENNAVVERLAGFGAGGQVNEVSHSYWSFGAEKVDFDCAVVGVQGRYVSVYSHASILAERL
jgi:hypothetical protein